MVAYLLTLSLSPNREVGVASQTRMNPTSFFNYLMQKPPIKTDKKNTSTFSVQLERWGFCINRKRLEEKLKSHWSKEEKKYFKFY